ncbi:cysteine desulfurase [Paenibacillus sp. JCM 10914]|nr:cysteine desulfurase [Paenibacillus sp. JCM 10914]
MIYQHEWELTQLLMEGLMQNDDLRLLGPGLGKPRTGIVSFVSGQYSSSELAFRLDREYGIAVRAGYHCTPLAHMASDTEQTGAVRVSVGVTTTQEDISVMLTAMKEIYS